MPGVVGRLIDAAYGKTNTWGVPSTVTQQILINSTEDFDNKPEVVTDESFSQDFIAEGEIGDHMPITPNLAMQLRFDQGADTFLAACMGSAADPAVVSSIAANSLVAYSHVVTLSPSLWWMGTLASNFQNYVQEIQSFKVSGFTVRVGDQGRMEVTFPIVGNKTVYDSTTNTSAAIAGATIATPGNRAFRRLTRLRMNAQSAGALGSTDIVPVAKEFQIAMTRPLAQDHVLNSDYIYEADDDGFVGFTMEITYARMTSAAANSMQVAMQTGNVFKMDILMSGRYINSLTQRSILWESPSVQVSSGGFKAVVTGHGQVRPVVNFDLRLAPAAPTGMSGLVNPLRVTITNTRSTNLLS